MTDTLEAYQSIENDFRTFLINKNFTEIRTATIQPLNLYTAAGTLTPNMLHETYSFLDWDGWSGERIVLRPDVTVPAAQWYLDNIPEEEGRLFYIEPVYRFNADNHDREIWQCGAELIGVNPEQANDEIIDLVSGILKKMNLKASIKITITNKDGQKPLSNYADLPVNGIAKKLIDAFNRIYKGSDFSYEIIEPDEHKKFEYYTNYAFAVTANGTQILSGGRYDNLCKELGGKEYPASGFAININEIVKLNNSRQQ
tara:strand:+ start:2191 stop:2958 length:768 start_codon:yes stop_codon:yes gene_type:complete